MITKEGHLLLHLIYLNVLGLFLKRTIPTSALVTFPNAGHLINLEEPEMFNRIVQDFITQVDKGIWPIRDERSKSNSALLGENS